MEPTSSKSDFYLDFSYFNPFIILDFIPEPPANSKAMKENPHVIHDFMFENQERVDLALAYKFASIEVIPKLFEHKESTFSKLTAAEIVGWIQSVHKLAAKTLASQHGLESGQFANTTILRWTKGSEMFRALEAAIINGKNTARVFEKYGLKEIHKRFFKIVEKVAKDPTIVDRESARAWYNQPGIKQTNTISDPAAKVRAERSQEFMKKLHKLCDARHQGKLSAEDYEVINQVFKIATQPEDIAAKLDAFSCRLIEKLKACDGTVQNVSALAAFVFAELTGIHPFFNGNGRIATIFMNVVLAIYGLPTISLRTVSEKLNSESSYNVAIDNIDKDQNHLRKHILQKVTNALLGESPKPRDVDYHLIALRQMQLFKNFSMLRQKGMSLEVLQQLLIRSYSSRATIDIPKELVNFHTSLTEPKTAPTVVDSVSVLSCSGAR